VKGQGAVRAQKCPTSKKHNLLLLQLIAISIANFSDFYVNIYILYELWGKILKKQQKITDFWKQFIAFRLDN
jgi:hypothetical protein